VIDRVLAKKRDGQRLEDDEIASFVAGVVDGTVSRPQAAAWLMAAFIRGLDDGEAVALTRAMTDGGDRLTWPGIDGPFVDKHSTGGVGDKVSLVLAPLWAELGWKVPMISGRGLGHTGGTLDKLEAIPGYRCDLDEAALRRALRDVGCFINGQTASLAPADRVLYALRNETQTVPAIPLIVASILSKKLAEGLDRLVLDVKVGVGAFMKTEADARRLAEAMVRVGSGAGVSTRALLTDMSQPLGQACGNALEVRESVACLQGGGPPDLRELTLKLADHPDAARVLASGAAYERFARMAHAHGGDLGALRCDAEVEVVLAPRSGVIARCDALAIGRAAFVLGAGRLRAEDAVDPAVGVTVLKKVGDRVEAREPLAILHTRDRGIEAARAAVHDAFDVADAAERPALVLGEIGRL
jgi:pyrimidine-nucleoside phosphorylase